MAEKPHNRDYLEDSPALKALLAEHGDIYEKAHTDALTGLPNRRAFDERLGYSAELAARVGADYSVATVDIQGLKEINDTYGLAVGDRAIKSVAEAMSAVRRKHEMIARTGGDELSIVAVNGDLGAFVERLEEELTKPEYAVDGKTLAVRTQVAVARPGETPEQVLERAQRIEKARHR